MYHSAIGSSVADYLLGLRPKRLVVDYHNITPPSWYEGWNHHLVHGLAWGRAQLSSLGHRARVGVADSSYNADELRAFGFRHTEVLPILIDPARTDAGIDRAARDRLQAGRTGAQWLFVGRICPNKCQHDVVKAFALYRRVYDPGAQLWLVGGVSADRYADAVRGFADDLGVGDAVTLTGPVDDAVLSAHYAAADVFVALSEHEGFLVPLLEAWHHGVPVLAFAATAVPETLGAGGLRLDDKAPPVVAAAVRRVMEDTPLRTALIAAGRRRLRDFAVEKTAEKVLDLAERIAGGWADPQIPGARTGAGTSPSRAVAAERAP
jgi:glycosyltransferase involved in cell wall biosynthesis